MFEADLTDAQTSLVVAHQILVFNKQPMLIPSYELQLTAVTINAIIILFSLFSFFHSSPNKEIQVWKISTFTLED